MSQSFAAMTTMVRRKLNQSGTAVYTALDIQDAIQEGLKEYATYVPHLVPVVFQVESRYGTASTTSTNNLVDTDKSQFLTSDDDNEKVVENRTDHTFAVISSVSNTGQVGLTGDIFAKADQYRIYNRQCWNQKQVYIGSVPENYEIKSVEYPIGNKRNWTVYDQVLEVDVDVVEDSNASSSITELPDVDVLVRFNKPHILTLLTDTAGKMSATAAAAATSITMTALQGAGTINVGEEFTIQYHKSTYVVAASATIASSAATVNFYPPLERAVASTAQTITFRSTTLNPQQEEPFADLVAARCAIVKGSKYINVVGLTPDPMGQYLDWGERRLAEVLGKLQRNQPPKTKKRYPSD